MPYLTEERKGELLKEPGLARTSGDWNYMYTSAMIKAWSAKQSYATIHAIKLAVRNPTHCEQIMEVESFFAFLNVALEDRFAARELAFFEFMRRVGNNYENQKITENGDVYDGVPNAQQIVLSRGKITITQDAEAIAMQVPLTTFSDDMEIGAGEPAEDFVKEKGKKGGKGK